jgi:hypothetical protein
MPRNHHTYPELQESVDLVVHTKSPQKWLLIDRETGQSYEGSPIGSWDKLVPKEREVADE